MVRTLLFMGDEIIPDDKNWTWVLEKPCDDCGFRASEFDVLKTGKALRDLASRWEIVLQQSGATVRPKPNVWSPTEYGCHVRDVFRKFDERLQLMIEELDPRFENWDQDKTAIEDDYEHQNPSVVSAELKDSAQLLARRFDAVRSDQWSRRGFRSDGSAFTVASIAQYLMHDPIHHLWDVGSEVPRY
ncbi:MAG: hypothetical protein RL114_315 [Actinomycetota bacterium]|jgi:hypothetical protein